jgi:hypothetical protein
MSPINPRRRGVVPVAIFGSEQLDVSEIDVTTLRFGPGRASTRHDLTDPWTYAGHLQDLNLDGFMDLVTHFPIQDTGIACGAGSAVLAGEMKDGVSIEGPPAVSREARCDYQ